ncbi:hypothetical protein GYMLUDRAFT_244003 [Collybiopsis luxurians FD-317 M1]|uniref:Uncharacterized protein n=1 Tax=Collybiopsis luxurians FD-317 M1 TaxID=944289 RepID=A0A0D0CPN5_9AGAR|nr:hypothetical protein GYMLUDRAFT_244003 [Collybiopsis luxurians FD-317 M1]
MTGTVVFNGLTILVCRTFPDLREVLGARAMIGMHSMNSTQMVMKTPNSHINSTFGVFGVSPSGPSSSPIASRAKLLNLEHLMKISGHRLKSSGATSNTLLSYHFALSQDRNRNGNTSSLSSRSYKYSFDELQSDPSSSSLLPIASGSTPLNRTSTIQNSSSAIDIVPIFGIYASSLPSWNAST